MTPTSALGGVLTGILDGFVIALLVLLGVYLAGRFSHGWHRDAAVVHPVAEDLPDRPGRRKVREGELPPIP